MKSIALSRAALFAGASIAAVIAAPAAATETTAAPTASATATIPEVVIRNGINPSTNPPGGALDNSVNLTGVGQVVTDAGGGYLGTCTGTLINPRTVIFAAHCVNTRPADAYGSATGGTAISVGFSANNLPGLLSWFLGSGGPKFGTNTAVNIYNVEQVWYDPRSLRTGFLEADIALATLDTPAFDIPTWAMLFSPLTSEEHALMIGYGTTGIGTTGGNTSGGWRRRAAENMVSFLGSLDERNSLLFGGTYTGLPQNVYMLDFDDPNYGQPGAYPYDFNIFGGAALPREGITAPGDSGGPLVIDQKYSIPVIAGVLSFGSRFYSAQPGSAYGTVSGYQPLYLFWDAIVANNPYVYATNKAGSRDWTDPTHWVQAMDPNYMIDRGGVLANDLPDTPALGVSGDGQKFGKVCFHSNCSDPLTGTAPTGDGTAIHIPGGPGSTDFVPNNVVGNPSQGIRSRYYDVTLAASGTTSLNSAVTIDRLTLAGPAKLDIGANGSLKAWGDFTQVAGWTHVDGLLKARESLIVSGILSGSGTIDPTYLTVINAVVSPGTDNVPATLTVLGDVILSSGSLLVIDAGRSGADHLKVVGDAQNAGILMLNGGSLLFNKAKGAAPRHGDTFTIASATGGVDGTFGNIGSLMGVLRPVLTYGTHDITAELRAGKFVDYVGTGNSITMAFAGALDALRAGSYASLYGLYGSIDLMSPTALAATFQGLAPKIAGETQSLQERQSKSMLHTVSSRLSMLGQAGKGSLSVYGRPASLALNGQVERQSLSDLGASRSIAALPNGMSAFIAGGSTAQKSMYGASGFGQGQYSDYVTTGIEQRVAPGLTIGSAAGYAEGVATPGIDRSSTKTSQVAIYGSYQLGGGAYVGAIGAAETSKADLLRNVSTGQSVFGLTGATRSKRYSASLEAGVNLGIAGQLVVTPRAQLAYSNYHLDGFRETGGEVAMKMDALRLETVEARMGAKLSGKASLGGGWSFVPELQADYVQVMSGANDGLAVRFANADEYEFLLPIANGARSRAEVRGGFRLAKGALEFGTGVQTSVGSGKLDDQRAVADFTVRF